ncbi:DUF2971 domain-containing protein [Pseudomonas sp. BIGb0427]|uniref:DUF2971 domain-containing protein n=1 Tax=Pseudomonas sp. BIGb0427 TaxID=2724470 RepID=UPI0018A73678|nr:DUF2971 domain-containing protein [Pseudomonas sp. BIGb0427]QPG61185.1 DUF2971 domain-containing protein [Pseudomonas sp. BIGb0427]
MNVYKYLSSDRKGFLDNGLIRFTQPLALNDPYECLAAFPDISPEAQFEKVLEGALKTVGYSESDPQDVRAAKAEVIKLAIQRLHAISKAKPNFLRDMADVVNGAKVNKSLGILSVSRRWDSALMWSHYTNTYKGFCVGFNRNHAFFQEVEDQGEMKQSGLLSVKYERKRTVVPQRREEAEGLDIFLTKSLDWAYEEEDRLLSLLKRADKTIDGKPYPVHLFKVPQDAITELIMGHNAPEELRVDILAAGDRLGVPVYRTEISRSSFDIERQLMKNEILI